MTEFEEIDVMTGRVLNKEKRRIDYVSSLTRLAVQAFDDVCKKEFSLEKAEAEHLYWLPQIPESEMDVYMGLTEQIQRKRDNQAEKWRKHREKLRPKK